MNQDQLKNTVYAIVNSIPKGFVLTYGTIAFLADIPRCARLVARFMTHSGGEINNHRVVNSAGRTAPGWLEQRTLLESEGVAFKKNGNVDLARHLWRA